MITHLKGVSLSMIYGVVSGLILTFLFKWMEAVTSVKVYTFLLNVDYIPIVGAIAYPEWLEVVFHLVVSVAVSLGFHVMFRMRPHWQKHAVAICIGVSVMIGIVLFPTTALSERTPALTDGTALFYWLLGHAVFGAALGILFRRTNQTTEKAFQPK